MNFRILLINTGSALVELSISIMLFLVIMYGIMEFGRVMYTKNLLCQAAREGARRAVVSTYANISTASSTVKRLAPGAIPQLDNVTKGQSPISSPPMKGDAVKMKASLTFTTIVPNIIPWLNTITLKSETTMRYEL